MRQDQNKPLGSGSRGNYLHTVYDDHDEPFCKILRLLGGFWGELLRVMSTCMTRSSLIIGARNDENLGKFTNQC